MLLKWMFFLITFLLAVYIYQYAFHGTTMWHFASVSYQQVEAQNKNETNNRHNSSPYTTSPGLANIGQKYKRKYLTMFSASEGQAGWYLALREASFLAMRLNRTLVEPCVSGGYIVPCKFGKVAQVPDGLDPNDIDTVLRGRDLLGFSRSRRSCRGDINNTNLSAIDNGTVYPLHFYLDTKYVAQHALFSPFILYFDWLKERIAPAETNRTVAENLDLLWVNPRNKNLYVPGPLFASKGDDFRPCRNWSFGFDNINFPRSVCPYRPGLGNSPYVEPDNMTVVLSEETYQNITDIFVNGWVRSGSRAPCGDEKPPRFNALHVAAVKHWISTVVRPTIDKRYAVFQWRSNRIPADRMIPCSTKLLNAAQSIPLFGVNSQTDDPRAVLVADMPAQANPCGIWEHKKSDTTRSDVVKAFSVSGFKKYDDYFPFIDEGVQAVRDLILAIDADWYISCTNGNICAQCSWGSSYVAQVLATRAELGRLSNTEWSKINVSNVRPPVI